MADMENLPYHRKYRPNTLMGYIGNEKTKTSVINVLKNGQKPQAMLLYGDSGCGKTTLARLIAKEYCCTDRDENLGSCNSCINCQTINEYIATGDNDLLSNITEVNVAEQSGKNDLSALLEDMYIPSFGGEWKIYIFDECHKASDGWQNSILKPLEEPPENVLIILCTTNPEKLIDTIRNRCQLQLKISKPKVKELAGLLRYVCECESMDYDQKGLEFIANRGELTIRTALQNLWKVCMSQQSAKYEDAIKEFEVVSDTLIINLFKALKSKNTFRYVSVLYEIKASMDLSAFLVELKNFVKRGIYTINNIQQDGVSDNELAIYRDLFGDMGVAQIGYLLNRLLSLNPNNLEMELLMLGYTGLDNPQNNQSDESVFDLDILSVDNELVQEKSNADKILKERAEMNYQQGVENASKQMEVANIDILMAMGGELVDG